jgi:hypothetical protein
LKRREQRKRRKTLTADQEGVSPRRRGENKKLCRRFTKMSADRRKFENQHLSKRGGTKEAEERTAPLISNDDRDLRVSEESVKKPRESFLEVLR